MLKVGFHAKFDLTSWVNKCTVVLSSRWARSATDAHTRVGYHAGINVGLFVAKVAANFSSNVYSFTQDRKLPWKQTLNSWSAQLHVTPISESAFFFGGGKGIIGRNIVFAMPLSFLRFIFFSYMWVQKTSGKKISKSSRSPR